MKYQLAPTEQISLKHKPIDTLVSIEAIDTMTNDQKIMRSIKKNINKIDSN